jgi:dienelactone hydrolase
MSAIEKNLNKLSLEQTATDWVNLLVAGKFDQAVKTFDNTMSSQIAADKLQDIWNSVVSQIGAFESIKDTRITTSGVHDIVFVTCNFSNTLLDIQLTFDASRKVAGLYFKPSNDAAHYSPPEYAHTSSFTETEVTIGTGQWLLPATLTMPKGDGPFPAVILVHGSGPNDRDETVGGNKPFKDLAWGLASQSIAVLRYEKRTKQFPQETAAIINTLTVQDETIDDALAAVTLLSGTKGIDTQRIFVLGHSLGGMLAPRIASQDSRIAGIIILAGPTRKLEDIMLTEVNYLASLDGIIDEKKAEQINAIKQQVKKIKDLDFNEGEIVLGAGKAYWQDLEEYDVVTTAKSLTIPIIILQGERDYQVTMEDFYGWANSLKGMNNVTLKTYADLNHLFITGTGKSTPSEYNQPGNVNETVIEDIAAWITSQS